MSEELNELSEIDSKAAEGADQVLRKVEQALSHGGSKLSKMGEYLYILESYREAKSKFKYCHSELMECLQELHEAGLIPNEHQ